MKHLLVLGSLFASAAAAFAGTSSTEILAEINLARTCPQQYARVIASSYSGNASSAVREAIAFLDSARPLPPLAFNSAIAASASSHVADQGARGSVGHSGSDHSRLGDRIARHGTWIGAAGENIYYGNSDARGIVTALIVDEGVRGRGHRKNIFSPSFAIAGVAHGRHARFGSMCVIDFAGGLVNKDASKIASARTGSRRSMVAWQGVTRYPSFRGFGRF